MLCVWWLGGVELRLCGCAAHHWGWNHKAAELGGPSGGLDPARRLHLKGSCASLAKALWIKDSQSLESEAPLISLCLSFFICKLGLITDGVIEGIP